LAETDMLKWKHFDLFAIVEWPRVVDFINS
jgi:hypothetical protein